MEVHLFRLPELRRDLESAGFRIDEVLPIDAVNARPIAAPRAPGRRSGRGAGSSSRGGRSNDFVTFRLQRGAQGGRVLAKPPGVPAPSRPRSRARPRDSWQAEPPRCCLSSRVGASKGKPEADHFKDLTTNWPLVIQAHADALASAREHASNCSRCTRRPPAATSPRPCGTTRTRSSRSSASFLPASSGATSAAPDPSRGEVPSVPQDGPAPDGHRPLPQRGPPPRRTPLSGRRGRGQRDRRRPVATLGGRVRRGDTAASSSRRPGARLLADEMRDRPAVGLRRRLRLNGSRTPTCRVRRPRRAARAAVGGIGGDALEGGVPEARPRGVRAAARAYILDEVARVARQPDPPRRSGRS